MASRLPFEIEYAPETYDHLAAIDRKYHHLIEETIIDQLSNTPEEETRNRKSLERSGPSGATWELRLGPQNRFRVFYQVRSGEHVVWITAIGTKRRERLLIANKEVNL